MFKVVYIFFVLQLAGNIQAQKIRPIDKNNSVQFIIKNLGFDVEGELTGLKGEIKFDENNLSQSFFQVSVNSATINTGSGSRDKHLRGTDYFDVSRFPIIKMTSTKIAKSATTGYYVFFGTLTLKGTTKEIVFPFTATSETEGIRFEGSFIIKRRDFNVGGKSTVSNELNVKLNVLAKK